MNIPFGWPKKRVEKQRRAGRSGATTHKRCRPRIKSSEERGVEGEGPEEIRSVEGEEKQLNGAWQVESANISRHPGEYFSWRKLKGSQSGWKSYFLGQRRIKKWLIKAGWKCSSAVTPCRKPICVSFSVALLEISLTLQPLQMTQLFWDS